MNIDGYLYRIGYAGSVEPCYDTLRHIQRAQAIAIPYETLDLFFGRPIVNDPSAAYEKLICQRRGGWCYEHNGLMGWALTELGFRVERMTAAVDHEATHMTLRVTIPDEGVYVCDPGFSDGPLEPFLLTDGDFQQDGFTYGLEVLSPDRFRFSNHALGLAHGYIAGPNDEAAMETASHWLQTAAGSRFLKAPVACIREESGIARCLTGRNLLTIQPDVVERYRLEASSDYVAVLNDVFGLSLPEAAQLWPIIIELEERNNRRRRKSR